MVMLHRLAALVTGLIVVLAVTALDSRCHGPAGSLRVRALRRSGR